MIHAQRMARWACIGATTALLAACGGVDVDVDDGPPPDVSLSTSTAVAPPGGPVRLSAAVSASNGIDHVSFYQVSTPTPMLLGQVFSPPAQWDTTIPTTAVGSVSYFARACDDDGYCTDSDAVSVTVVP